VGCNRGISHFSRRKWLRRTTHANNMRKIPLSRT
jgi:hypothetical protein